MRYEIIVDHGETANKCTITPLRDRADFRLFPVRGEEALGPLTAPLLLHPDGVCLTRFDGPRPVEALGSIDCVWRRLPVLLRRLSWVGTAPTFARIPDGFVTAYPRVGKTSADPEGGLATIEALFTAAALLGNWDVSLLSRYYFAKVFVERNAARFAELGVPQAGNEAHWPPQFQLQRTAHTRNVNRGRLRTERHR